MTPTPEDRPLSADPSAPEAPGEPRHESPVPKSTHLSAQDPPAPPPAVPPAGAAPPAWRGLVLAAFSFVAVTAALLAFWAAGGFRLASGPAAPTLPVVDMSASSPFKGLRVIPERPAADFTLASQTGAPFRMLDQRGKVVLLFFGFTSCPDVCPTTLGKVASALDALGPDADKVQVVFVSVDPERDTPEAIARYLTSFDPRIVGVTGDLETLEAVAGDYGVRFYKEYPAGATGDAAGAASDPAGPASDTADTYTMAHSSTVFVIDPQGQLRTSFLEPYTPDDIAHDIRVLLDEAGT